MDHDESFGKGPQRFGATRGAVDRAAESSRGTGLTCQHDLAFTTQIEDGRGAHVWGDRGTGDRSVTAETEVEGAEEQGLAGAGFTGEDVEAGPEFEARVFNHSKSVGVELQELRLRHVPLEGPR